MRKELENSQSLFAQNDQRISTKFEKHGNRVKYRARKMLYEEELTSKS